MPTINQLSSIGEVTSADQIPTYDESNGDTRKMSVLQLQDYMQDNLSFPGVASNASGVTYNPAGTGATARTVESKLRDVVSVKDFGAVGNNSTDDTVAIQNAINSGAKVIWFPAGNYIFTTLTIPLRVTLEGEGADVTYLKTATTGNALLLNGERITLKQFTLQQTSGSRQGKGIVGSDKYWLITECVKVLGFDYGLYCDKSLYHSHKQTWFENGNYGAYYWGASTIWNTDWYNNVITFDTCRFNGNTNVGTYIKGTEVVFINPDFSGMSATNSIGLQVVGQSAGYPAHGIKIIEPYAELTDIVFSFSYAYAQIDGGFVQGGTAAGASAATSIIDADNSTVFWRERPRDQDYWDYGYRLTNNTQLVFDYGFSGSVRASNTADATSKAAFTADYDEGTFTATLTGCTTSPTGTAYYVRNAKQVTISIPQITGTSNSALSGLSGLPAALYPAREQLMFGAFFDAGAESSGVIRVQTSGAINFYPTKFGDSFVTSGTKGNRTLTMSYALI